MEQELPNPALEIEESTSVNPLVTDRIVQILRKQYIPYVKKAIQELEVLTGKRSKRAIYELRDALDHIAIAVQQSTTEEKAIKSLNAVEEHLRRATVEPAEFVALEKLKKLLQIKDRGFWWWKLFFLKAPDTKEFDTEIFKGQQFLSEGRYYKAISVKDSYLNLQKAYRVFQELLNKIQPAELNSRIFALVSGLVIAVLFFILGKIL